MSFFQLAFRLLCILCCLAVVTSYVTDHRPWLNDRNNRAVTEWRFRRQHPMHFPHSSRGLNKIHHLFDEDSDEISPVVELHSNDKNYLIPAVVADQIKD